MNNKFTSSLVVLAVGGLMFVGSAIAQSTNNTSGAGPGVVDPGHPRVNEVNAREANQQVGAITTSTLFINRMQWKFQGWLQGMNGGPLRQPTMKISDRAMAPLRRGLTDARLNPTQEPNRAFFIGRNPTG